MINFLKASSPYTLFVVIALSFLLRLLFLGNYNLLTEEAYYWNYAAHLDMGYLDHPPMVAVLIKLSTVLLGVNEFGVRFPALLCWIVTAYYSYALTELIRRGAGLYAAMLLSIMPFFFMYSLVITPDLPLIACWSAALYYLYQAICLNRAQAWYWVGIAVGLGLLSKYSMVLLILATLIYLLTTPKARFWFLHKEPYMATSIVILLFMPVIYWNATHDWISFAFQSTRRFSSSFSFSFHELVGLLIVFLTPVGVAGLCHLLKKQPLTSSSLEPFTQHFLRVYTLTPLAVFAFFSLTRAIKCNWIGPSLLATLPWLAIMMQTQALIRRHWLATTSILFVLYTLVLCCITFGTPQWANRTLFNKHIAWDNLTQQFAAIAHNLDAQDKQPIFMPLDSYSIASELSFYQAKQLQHDDSLEVYPVLGAGFFGYNSLMFDYWSRKNKLAGRTVILIAKLQNLLNTPFILEKTTPLSQPITVWAHSQGKGMHVKPYYYQIVRINAK